MEGVVGRIAREDWRAAKSAAEPMAAHITPIKQLISR